MVCRTLYVVNKCMPISLPPLLPSSPFSDSNAQVSLACPPTKWIALYHLQLYMEQGENKPHEKLHDKEQRIQKGSKCQV